MKTLPSLIRYHHSLGPDTTAFANHAAFVPYLDFNKINIIATCTVHSKLDYCNYLHFNLSVDSEKQTSAHSESLARNVANIRYPNTRTSLLFSNLFSGKNRWTIERIQYKLISLTYKILTTSQHTYLHNFVSLHNTRSSDVVTLARPPSHPPPLLWKSLIALFSMPRLIPEGTNFLLHFVNQFHLLMLTSTHLSVLRFLRPSILHSFTLNS